MLNKVSPISFQGHILVSTYNKGEEKLFRYSMDNAQFKLIKSVIDDIAPIGKETSVKSRKVNFLYSYLRNKFGCKENFSGIYDEKLIFNSKDSITIQDKDAKMFDGIKIDIQRWGKYGIPDKNKEYKC